MFAARQPRLCRPPLRDLCSLCVKKNIHHCTSLGRAGRISTSRIPHSFHPYPRKGKKLTSIFSTRSALLKKEYFRNPPNFNHLRTLLKNTGGVPRRPSGPPNLFRLFPQSPSIPRTPIPAIPICSAVYFIILWIPGGGGLSFGVEHAFLTVFSLLAGSYDRQCSVTRRGSTGTISCAPPSRPPVQSHWSGHRMNHRRARAP